MTAYVTGAAGTVAFYATVLCVGVWAAAIKRRKSPGGLDNLILANRDLGLYLGVISLVATWVGGAFISGTAEVIYNKGLIWCQVPIGYSLSLLFGALFFVKPMRKAEHVTILDPFQQHYGARVGSLLFLPALCGDLFWCAAVLRALGSSLFVVAGVNPNISVCASALLAATYTVFGGLYSVACTDALQLICITVALAISVPFSALHQAVSLERSLATKEWLGEIKSDDFGEWIDKMLLLIFGGIPWQAYFQRILGIKNTSVARALSVVSMFGCLALAVPSAMIGIVARATNWPLVEHFNRSFGTDNGNAVLPLVIRHLTPHWVSFLGLGAVCAAVMSSADSSILSSSSMFTRNIYRITLRPKASERELEWILRIAVLAMSLLSAAVALSIGSVYYMSYLCTDIIYVVLFPQFVSVIHWPDKVDTYGCLAGYVVSVAMRVAGGENEIGLPTYYEYPFYDRATRTQKFPFRTATVLCSLVTQLVVSFFTRNLLGNGYFPRCCDVLKVYSHGSSKTQTGVVQSSSGAALIKSNTESNILRASSYDCIDGEMTNLNLIRRESNDRCEITKSRSAENVIQHANQNLQNLKLLQEQSGKTGTLSRQTVNNHTLNRNGGQILGVRNLTTTMTHPEMQENFRMAQIIDGVHLRQLKPIIINSGNSSFSKTTNMEKTSGDRSNMELNFNLNDGQTMKKNVKGVKLIGMEGGTLRRPSIQTFSPTPSVEMVHILDARRPSSGSYGPSSLSPVPGVEACRTHGTAVTGQTGNDHCRIKRSIVRHHSFNDTGDRSLTTLARQPNYPSMPLRPEDCRMTIKRDRKSVCVSPYPPNVDDKMFNCSNLARLASPTYNMYGSAVKACNYYVADDEAVSRF